MSYELLYTSAARGLKPGSQGFCVVVSTQGMPANLSDRLESLSGYRHVFPPQDPQAALNPIVWSHLRLAVAGRTYHVLSRIAAAGLDYTQRSNKIAHYVALESSELVPAGPAALLSASDFMASDWDGQARLLPQGRIAPALSVAPAVCGAWQAATGDAGWGGVLAETATGSAPRPVLLIFRPGMDVLSLIAESLALVPPERRWQVTFSSYYTRLPAGVDCQWRAVVADSPEALGARQVPGALLIDLTRPLAPAQGGALVDAARTGRVVADVKDSPALAAGARRSTRGAAHFAGDDNLAGRAAARARSVHPLMADNDIGLDAGIDLGPPPRPGEALWKPPAARTLYPKPQSRWPLWLASAVGLLLCVALGLALWHRFTPAAVVAQSHDLGPPHHVHGEPGKTQQQALVPADRPPDLRIFTPPDDDSQPEMSDPRSGGDTDPEAPDNPTSDPYASSPDGDNPESPFDTSPAAPDLLPPGDPSVEPVAEPDARARLESIPAFVELPQFVNGQPWKELFSLPILPVSHSLKLRGPRMADGAQLVLKRDGETNFSILVETSSAVGGSEPIAHLEQRGQALDFRWEPLKNGDQSKRWRELKNQVLRIRFEGLGERIVALRKPERAAPLRLALTGRPAESSWELDAPPGGEYIPKVWVGESLSLSSHGQLLSVNLRSDPAATPVLMSVEVIPPSVSGKHVLQSKLKCRVRSTYLGVQIARDHLKADDPRAFEPTSDPEPITPDGLRSYLRALDEQIRTDREKLQALRAPPAGGGPPADAASTGDAPPVDKQQLETNLRLWGKHLRQAHELEHLFAVLQSATFNFRVYCDIDGHPVCVVSTTEPGAPLISSSRGP